MKAVIIEVFGDMHYLEQSPFSCETLEVSLGCSHKHHRPSQYAKKVSLTEVEPADEISQGDC